MQPIQAQIRLARKLLNTLARYFKYFLNIFNNDTNPSQPLLSFTPFVPSFFLPQEFTP